MGWIDNADYWICPVSGNEENSDDTFKDSTGKAHVNDGQNKHTSLLEIPIISCEEPSAKYDNGKISPSLVPPEIIEQIAKVREYGVKKYNDPENWRKASLRAIARNAGPFVLRRSKKNINRKRNERKR